MKEGRKVKRGMRGREGGSERVLREEGRRGSGRRE